jgi:hypothetical protein
MYNRIEALVPKTHISNAIAVAMRLWTTHGVGFYSLTASAEKSNGSSESWGEYPAVIKKG